MAQIIADSPIIEQHLIRTQCSSFINSSTAHIMSIPIEDKNKVLIWTDTNHYKTGLCIYLLGIYEIKQPKEYILIPDIQAVGAVQEEFGDERYQLQLGNGIKLRN